MLVLKISCKEKVNIDDCHDLRAVTLVSVGFVSAVLVSTLRALRSYTDLLILLHLGLC